MKMHQLAKSLARSTGKTVEEEESILDRRQRDINLHGYGYAFSHDSVMTYEKSEWLRKNNKLGGKNHGQQERF